MRSGKPTCAPPCTKPTRSGDPIIAERARRHGIGDDDVLHAYSHPTFVEEPDEGILRCIGPDRAGTLLEVGFVVGADGPVIGHAVEARPRWNRPADL